MHFVPDLNSAHFQALAEIDHLKTQLMIPYPLRILVASQSPATQSLLNTMLGGFFVSSASSIEEAQGFLRDTCNIYPPLDFILFDEQSEPRADEFCRFLHQFPGDPYRDTKIVHLYTPTTDSLTGQAAFANNTPGVVRMTKPPRKARLLHMLTILKHPEQRQALQTGVTGMADEQAALEARTLYGNVLIAEGAS